jgi:GT2 family glycosyltransferase
MENKLDNGNVSIIILNWNGKKDTLDCISSVKKLEYPDYKIIVVDNGSTDGSVEAISEQYSDVTLLQTGANLGYAGGNNVGIRWAIEHETDYILILNNDTEIAPNLLTAFVSAAKSSPKGSILGAKIYYYDKPNTLWFAGGIWDSANNRTEHIGMGEEDGAGFEASIEIDYITGCALFADTETFVETGLLDEEFFLTFEETDWCYRAKAKGHKCIVIPDAKLWHKVSSSFGGAESPIVAYFMTRNKLLWAKRHQPLLTRLKLHIENSNTLRQILFPTWNLDRKNVPLLKSLLWAASTWIKTIKRNINNPINIAILLGIRDYYLGRFGNCPDQVRRLGK